MTVLCNLASPRLTARYSNLDKCMEISHEMISKLDLHRRKHRLVRSTSARDSTMTSSSFVVMGYLVSHPI